MPLSVLSPTPFSSQKSAGKITLAAAEHAGKQYLQELKDYDIPEKIQMEALLYTGRSCPYVSDRINA